jgi:crotonobetainyl-CoA:carnitine CoA-transferase CaiB-like acyl-CoA transferase
VYCSISGYGQTGPLSNAPAFALLISAISGLMHLEQQDDPAPRPGYLQAADVLAGTHAFGAILAALWRRARTGRGAYLDVAMLECLVAAEDVTFGSVLNGGPVWPGPRPGMIVHRIGQRDLAMQTVGAPQLWSRLLGLMGRPELSDDPRFATPIARRQNWSALRQIIVQWLGRFASVDEAVQTLTRARLPAVPVLSPQEVIEHPHMTARGAFAEVPHPARGRVRVTATPFRVDGQAPGPRGPAPYRVGEHTHKVLTEILGYAPERIDELCTLGAIETG